MTIADICNVANVSRRTIRRVVDSLFPGKMANGHRTTFSHEEVQRILGTVRKVGNVVSEPGQIAHPAQVRPKLPNGKQLETLYRAAKDKLISPFQFQEAIGVTVERVEVRGPAEGVRMIDAPLSPEVVERELRSLMPVQAVLSANKVEAAANGARSNALNRQVSRLTQDRMNYHLPLERGNP